MWSSILSKSISFKTPDFCYYIAAIFWVSRRLTLLETATRVDMQRLKYSLTKEKIDIKLIPGNYTGTAGSC